MQCRRPQVPPRCCFSTEPMTCYSTPAPPGSWGSPQVPLPPGTAGPPRHSSTPSGGPAAGAEMLSPPGPQAQTCSRFPGRRPRGSQDSERSLLRTGRWELAWKQGALCFTENAQPPGPATKHSGLCSVLRVSLDGRRVSGRTDHVCVWLSPFAIYLKLLQHW